MTMSKFFVTGGAGVIGQELVEEILSQGHEVLVGDLKPQPKNFLGRVDYLQMDLNDLTLEELERRKPNFLIHLAATFERSVETRNFWNENFHNNVRLSHHITTLATQLSSLERLVFASSYLVYDPSSYIFEQPQSASTRLSVGSPILPRNLVGAAKLFHERELEFLSGFLQPNLDIVSARIYRGFGKGSRDVISRWARLALIGQPLAAHNLEGRFDYIFARDSASALLALATSSARGIFDVGTGQSHSVRDVLDLLSLEIPSIRIDLQEDVSTYESSCADISRISSLTGWKPKVSLAEGVRAVVMHEATLLESK
jgi:carbamoyl-phosphate synthase large subunit